MHGTKIELLVFEFVFLIISMIFLYAYGGEMQINIEKNLVEFGPENPDERARVEALWRILVDCVRFNKKLVPVGEYIATRDNIARFQIEGKEAGGSDGFPEVYAESVCRAYCKTCNKYVELGKGDRVPPCCGKIMEILA